MTIITKARKDHIIRCRPSKSCNSLRLSYDSKYRKRNIDLLERWAPSTLNRIAIVYVCESPPASKAYFYDIGSRRAWLSRRIIEDLRDNLKMDDFLKFENNKRLRKIDLLCNLRRNGIIVIDCCQCAVNDMRMVEREEVTIDCFYLHSRRIIERIMKKSHAEIRFLFPNCHGKTLLTYLIDRYPSRVEVVPT